MIDPLVYIPKYLKVLTKQDELIPMVLRPLQEYYIKNRTNRDIVLKGRQMGSSTGVMASNAVITFTQPYIRGAIITHKGDVSEFLFQTFQRFYNNLPDNMKPHSDWSSGRRIRLDKLDCFVHIDSAESEAIGFGETLKWAHLSEMSRWPRTKELELFKGISQTVPLDGYVTVESTPRGRGGLFFRLYQAAKKKEIDYRTFFFPWWWDPGYRVPVEEALKFTNEEAVLMDRYNLDPEQVNFRRKKIAEFKASGDEAGFFQEYPENEVDCWLSSEISVFDGTVIREYLQQIKEGRNEGHLTIWKDTMGTEKYVIGVDVAGGLRQGDYSVASVLNVKRNEYVARVRGKIAPDLFAQEVLRLGYRYNTALIAVEKAAHGHMVIKTLLEQDYPNIYYYEDYDMLLSQNLTHPGWKTSVKTKPIMVSTLQAVLRARDIQLWSENFLMEASSYMKEGDIYISSSGCHDDELDAVMIAIQVREQAPIYEEARYRPSSYVTL